AGGAAPVPAGGGPRPRRALRCRLAALALAATSSPADPPPKDKTPAKAPAPGPTKPEAPTPRTLDDFKKLPPGAVLVIIKDFEEGRKLVPRGVFLDPDEYLKLIEENKDLKLRLNGDKPPPPAECHVGGAVQGNVARLQT